MPPRKRPASGGSTSGRSGGGRRGSGRGRTDGEPELTRNPDADPVQIHRDYVERRIGGGEPPTTDAYARALEEFQRLPGAVRMPASETTPDVVRRRTGTAGGDDGGPESGDEAAAQDAADTERTGDAGTEGAGTEPGGTERAGTAAAGTEGADREPAGTRATGTDAATAEEAAGAGGGQEDTGGGWENTGGVWEPGR